ncbi:MAG TPA: response regulator, partial [Acidimicrobiales bacterium]|nr:response regulator [Acidimicrobiales bacterium]
MTETTPRRAGDRPVRVLLVNEDEIILEGLQGMLAGHSDQVEVVGGVVLTDDVSSQANALDADVVLIDLDIHGTNGLDVAAEMVADKPPFRVVIFTDDADERRLFDALRLGISGYLLRSVGTIQLVDHLVRVRNGEVIVDPTM